MSIYHPLYYMFLLRQQTHPGTFGKHTSTEFVPFFNERDKMGHFITTPKKICKLKGEYTKTDAKDSSMNRFFTLKSQQLSHSPQKSLRKPMTPYRPLSSTSITAPTQLRQPGRSQMKFKGMQQNQSLFPNQLNKKQSPNKNRNQKINKRTVQSGFERMKSKTEVNQMRKQRDDFMIKGQNIDCSLVARYRAMQKLSLQPLTDFQKGHENFIKIMAHHKAMANKVALEEMDY